MWHKRINIAVFVLISLLGLTLFLPLVQEAREHARKTQSRNNLKQIGIALFNYTDTFRGLPPGGIFDLERRGYVGWMTSILPYMDDSPFYNYVNMNVPWDSTANAGLFLNRLQCYENPSEPLVQKHWEFPVTHYSANAHIMAANSFVKFKSLEDEKAVFLVGELDGDFTPWGCPYNWRQLDSINSTPPTFGRSTRDGCQFLFGDGRVEFVPNSVSLDVLKRMSGEDLAGFEINEMNVHRPARFPCPADALWFSWTYAADGRIETKRDIDGNVKSEEKIRGK